LLAAGLLGWKTKTINKEKLAAHHDALEFPDGRIVLLTLLCEGQAAGVLQLPAQPKTVAEAREQQRVGFVGWTIIKSPWGLSGRTEGAAVMWFIGGRPRCPEL
jgi:hypothetical protein